MHVPNISFCNTTVHRLRAFVPCIAIAMYGTHMVDAYRATAQVAADGSTPCRRMYIIHQSITCQLYVLYTSVIKPFGRVDRPEPVARKRGWFWAVYATTGRLS